MLIENFGLPGGISRTQAAIDATSLTASTSSLCELSAAGCLQFLRKVARPDRP